MHTNFGGGSHNQWKKKNPPLFHCDFARGRAVSVEITHVASCKGAWLTSERPQVYI